jgi:hypothetical protein
MLEVKLPLDFERLPEFWQLAERLRTERLKVLRQRLQDAKTAGETAALPEREIQQMAILLWMRLWVVLGYLARSTNRPGWLNEGGVRQVNAAFDQFGEEETPVEILTGSLLRKAEGSRLVPQSGIPPSGTEGAVPEAGAPTEYVCDLFAATNGHLAGDYLAPEKRGNLRSRLNAAKNTIAAMAMQQAQLLPPEIYKKRDGSVMTQREVDRSMVLILTLDRCLKARPRTKGDFTQGLLADACAALEETKPAELQEFYYWLLEHAEHPAVPKTAEDILKEWGRVFGSSKTED